MQPELELVKLWVDRARTDLLSAEADLAYKTPIVEDACFHCQQAVEKILKAFLVFHGVEFEYTHQIERLIEQCVRLNPSFARLHDTADQLTVYAVRFRYPYTGPLPTLDHVRRLLSIAQETCNFVFDRLPRELR